MKIELRLFASLKKYHQDSDKQIDILQTITVEQLLQNKGVPVKEAPIVLVNGIRVGHKHVLADGDTVSVFPLIGGG